MTKSTFGIPMGIMIVFCVLCIATLVLLFLKFVNDKTRWKEEAEERFKRTKLLYQGNLLWIILFQRVL